jgi:hypothetical protein
MKLITTWGVRSRRLDQLLERDCPHCGGSAGRLVCLGRPNDQVRSGVGVCNCGRLNQAAERAGRAPSNPSRPEEDIMTISALCIFSGGLPQTNPDAAAEAVRAAGYQVFRLPQGRSSGKIEPDPSLKDDVPNAIGALARCNQLPIGTYACVALGHDGREALIPEFPVGGRGGDEGSRCAGEIRPTQIWREGEINGRG